MRTPHSSLAFRLKPDLAAFHSNLGTAPAPKASGRSHCRIPRGDPAQTRFRRCTSNNWAWTSGALPKNPASASTTQGLVHARKAVELAKKGANYYNTLALAEYCSGHLAESLAASEQSMKLRKGLYAYDWFFVAMARWRKGDKDEARKWFDKAVAWTKEKDPKNVELRQFWAEAAELLGRPGPAPRPRLPQARNPLNGCDQRVVTSKPTSFLFQDRWPLCLALKPRKCRFPGPIP